MNLRGFLLILLLFSFWNAKVCAQRVFVAASSESADISVFVSKHPFKADLLVSKVSSWNQARNNLGRWYFEESPFAADVNIWFTKNETEADLVICFVDFVTQTGWVNRRKTFLLE